MSTRCRVDVCDRDASIKGLCPAHRRRELRGLPIDAPVRARRSPRLPLAEYLEQNSIPEPNTGCILWTGAVSENGYAQVSEGGRNRNGHRIAWVLQNGDIPDGLVVRHRCDTRPCINVDHLELGTHADNMRDMKERGRAPRGERGGSAQVTSEMVSQMRTRHRRGESYTEISRDLDVTLGIVWDAVNGKTWKHIDTPVNDYGLIKPAYCKRGHKITAQTSYQRRQGCPACRADKQRERRQARTREAAA